MYTYLHMLIFPEGDFLTLTYRFRASRFSERKLNTHHFNSDNFLTNFGHVRSMTGDKPLVTKFFMLIPNFEVKK